MQGEYIKLEEEFDSLNQKWPVYLETNLYKDTYGKIIQDDYLRFKDQYEAAVDSYNKLENEYTNMTELVNENKINLDKYEQIYASEYDKYRDIKSRIYGDIRGLVHIE